MTSKYLKIRILYLFVFIVCFSTLQLFPAIDQQEKTFSQNSLIQKEEKNLIIDSLVNKEYTFLENMFFKNIKKTSKAKIYAHGYLKKARIKNEIKKIIKGYYLLSHVSEDSIALKYCDTIIDISRNRNHRNQPALSYYKKGNIFYQNRKYKLASENFILANKDASIKKNKNLIYKTKFNLGLIKSRLGKYQEAKEIFNENYEYATKKLNESDSISIYKFLLALYAKSETYTKLNFLDSSSSMNSLGFKISSRNNISDLKNYFVMSEGVNLYFKKEYSNALDSLKKVMPWLDKKNDKSNILYSTVYLGKIYNQTGDHINALKHFKLVDSLFQKNPDFGPEIRDAYKFLIDYYKNKEDQKNQLKYLEKLIVIDSLQNDSFQKINNNIVDDFDTPSLLLQKEEIIKKQKSNYNFISGILIFVASLAFILSVFLFLNYRKRKKMKEKFEIYLNDKTTSDKLLESLPEKEKNNISDIPENTILRIKEGLIIFEQERKYLEKNITLSSLSSSFETNPNYMSRVLKNLKQKRITDYINELRINHIVEKLKNDQKFRRQYTVKAISEIAGFSNPVSFSNAFHKVTGMKPSFFIRALEKRNI